MQEADNENEKINFRKNRLQNIIENLCTVLKYNEQVFFAVDFWGYN